MHLFALGINHHLAPVSLRERVAFQPEQIAEALGNLVQTSSLREAAVLSTCNRTEIYCSTGRDEAGCPVELAQWFALWHQMALPDLAPYLFKLSGLDVVKHVFRVASGLDSMVLGEAQILGQMKLAVRTAEEAGTLGGLLHKLFQKTFAVAKQVRTSTAIGANTVSMAAAAVRLSERIFESVREQRVLFVGAGEMAELAAAHFAGCAPAHLTIANRSLPRAQALACRFGGDALALEFLPEVLGQYDIVVASTASPLPVISLAMVERALKVRRYRPMVIVDLAVPRNIESEVAGLDDVYLYTLDELSLIVEDGAESRQIARVEAETIIDEQVGEFRRWIEARDAVPAIRALRAHAEGLRRAEMERAQARLARGDSPEAVLEALSQGLTNKLLHAPLHYLNEAESEQLPVATDLVRNLFNIDLS